MVFIQKRRGASAKRKTSDEYNEDAAGEFYDEATGTVNEPGFRWIDLLGVWSAADSDPLFGKRIAKALVYDTDAVGAEVSSLIPATTESMKLKKII